MLRAVTRGSLKRLAGGKRKREHVSLAYESADGEEERKREPNASVAPPPAEEAEPPAKSAKKPRKKRKSAVSAPVEPRAKPEGWQEVLRAIEGMRAARDAPVDGMGCEVLAEEEVPDKTFRYQTLVALMLSSQTKDEVTAAGVKRLQGFGLTAESIAAADEAALGKLIHPVGFWRKKASYLKRTSAILCEKYDGDIPPTVEEMVALPGVGPKMAFLAMSCAWKNCVGIGVDVHVHRISNRLGWVDSKKPEQTRVQLESWLPRSLWNDINVLLVGFGQQICTPRKPKCDSCAAAALCPSASV
eukprot:PLAT6964.1.p1 GENE.PLAT6964.1~~PLAT6964.1.p1  ORF type:complete len:301 (-),score=90.85 PLAT6964.1:188-1090(-)